MPPLLHVISNTSNPLHRKGLRLNRGRGQVVRRDDDHYPCREAEPPYLPEKPHTAGALPQGKQSGHSRQLRRIQSCHRHKPEATGEEQRGQPRQGGGLLVEPLQGHLPVSISQPTASPPSATASSSTDVASSSVTARSWGSPDVHTQRKGPNPRENMSLQRQKASWPRGFPARLHPLMGWGHREPRREGLHMLRN